MGHGTHVEVRGQLAGVGPLFTPWGFQDRTKVVGLEPSHLHVMNHPPTQQTWTLTGLEIC